MITDCFSTCINQTCDGTSGHCTFGCETGYWGSTCASLCPDKCQDRKCFRDNGLCKTCEPGHWGFHCNHTCSSFCNKNICNQSNGGCSIGCIMGRYGDTCDNACSPGCVHRSCDSQSASCSEGCHQNWMGTRCDSMYWFLYSFYKLKKKHQKICLTIVKHIESIFLKSVSIYFTQVINQQCRYYSWKNEVFNHFLSFNAYTRKS